jgi:hypothetical protein
MRMVSFVIYRPDVPTRDMAILVFLHGIGEAFENSKTGSVGFKNLFQQGVPKALHDPINSLPDHHPLRTGAFAVVVPQLMMREAPWEQKGNAIQIRRVLGTIAPETQRSVYLMGFSKGGQAAFRLAHHLKARAVVTIDASPMNRDPDDVAQEMSNCEFPLWSIYTNHRPERNSGKISELHARMTVLEHEVRSPAAIASPAEGAKHKSLIVLDHVAENERHGALCTIVTTSVAPYEWLLKH